MVEERRQATEFSETYREAAAKFRAAAAKRGLAVETFINPERGPEGEQLETAVVQLGNPEATHVIVLNTGIHGTEALACGAILTGLLEDQGEFLRDTPDFKAVLIHILNPYGAAWLRYVNEDNVDLMKNIVYGDASTPADPLFIAFDDIIDLRRIREPDATARALQARKDFLAEHGLDALMKSLKKGQSDRPKSICYNGRGTTWSTRILGEILKKYAGDAKQVMFVDLHTGVGAYGEAHVIVGGSAESEARVRSLLGEEAHVTDLVVPRPAYTAQADLLPGAMFTAVTVEAGTETFDDTFRDAMWLEMHDHMYGDPRSPEAQQNKQRFRSFYYPSDPEWRTTWRSNCRAMLNRFVAGMKTWSQKAIT